MSDILRARFTEGLKQAMKEQDKRATSTLRLILAALKDRDVAARTKGRQDGVTEDEMLAMLQSMIKQRQESISLYEQGGRCELAEREREEMEIIQSFLPTQLDGDDMIEAVDGVLNEIGAASIKDMGRAMAELKQRYAGQLDFAKASLLVKQRLVGAA
jgi:uncharacterized protein